MRTCRSGQLKISDFHRSEFQTKRATLRMSNQNGSGLVPAQVRTLPSAFTSISFLSSFVTHINLNFIILKYGWKEV